MAGPPGTTAHIGDAGEPHGTAGRPILNTLLHSGVGEIVAVVTRYFGGVKLGKSGLGRAYSGCVSKALETLRTTIKVSLVTIRVCVPFASTDRLFRLLEQFEASERRVRYGSDVEVVARVPREALSRLVGELAGLTSGQGGVEVLDSGGSIA